MSHVLSLESISPCPWAFRNTAFSRGRSECYIKKGKYEIKNCDSHKNSRTQSISIKSNLERKSLEKYILYVSEDVILGLKCFNKHNRAVVHPRFFKGSVTRWRTYGDMEILPLLGRATVIER